MRVAGSVWRRSSGMACYCGRPVILAAFFPREARSNVVRVAAAQEDSIQMIESRLMGPVSGCPWVVKRMPVGGELCR